MDTTECGDRGPLPLHSCSYDTTEFATTLLRFANSVTLRYSPARCAADEIFLCRPVCQSFKKDNYIFFGFTPINACMMASLSTHQALMHNRRGATEKNYAFEVTSIVSSTKLNYIIDYDNCSRSAWLLTWFTKQLYIRLRTYIKTPCSTGRREHEYPL
jgi:hypothetical protein